MSLVLLCSCSDNKGTDPVQTTAPTVSTIIVSAVTETTAECGGTITSDGGAAVTARGVCWSTDVTPTTADNITTDGTGTGSFVSSLTGLVAGAPYDVRAYATNSAGTGYGEERSFTTAPQGLSDSTGTVTDYDSNVYPTVKIGDQWWMAENLKVTHFRNGDTIPIELNGPAWEALTNGAYCKYDNNDDSAGIFGLLYNWYAATDVRNIAPEGWHVPSETEWSALNAFLGANAGGKLKDTGTAYWWSPNEGATNESGFTGLPGGLRGFQGTYVNQGVRGRFWSTTRNYPCCAISYDLFYADSVLSQVGDLAATGCSIRCIKD
ncbi:MAG: FISUMP domain-containing protein [Candidatus Zixiibacteriota bacterium]